MHQLTLMDQELRAQSIPGASAEEFQNIQVTTQILGSFLPLGAEVLLEADGKQMDLSGLLGQVSRAGG